MQLPVIRSIVEQFSLEQLTAAENALLEGEALAITIPGADEGEQLTHVLAAIWIKQHMAETGADAALATRTYAQRVRNSIS